MLASEQASTGVAHLKRWAKSKFQMTSSEFTPHLLSLIGEPIVFKRIAGNSLILYFYSEPGANNVISIWLDPTWRYETNLGIVMGSGDIPLDNSKDGLSSEFDRICRLSDPIQGSFLRGFEFGKYTCDLTLSLSGDNYIRSFSNGASNGPAWTYHNVPSGLVIDVFASGITLR